jgi:hypothetical protein
MSVGGSAKEGRARSVAEFPAADDARFADLRFAPIHVIVAPGSTASGR